MRDGLDVLNEMKFQTVFENWRWRLLLLCSVSLLWMGIRML